MLAHVCKRKEKKGGGECYAVRRFCKKQLEVDPSYPATCVCVSRDKEDIRELDMTGHGRALSMERCAYASYLHTKPEGPKKWFRLLQYNLDCIYMHYF